MRLKGGERTCDLGTVRVMLFLGEKNKMIVLILPFMLHSHQSESFRNEASSVCFIQLQKYSRILEHQSILGLFLFCFVFFYEANAFKNKVNQ